MSSPSKEEILIIGEILRLKLHQDPSLIKDRRYRLRTYTCCFVGRELVEWLVKSGEAFNHTNGVGCMRILQENDILHHVCDDHIFKNEYLFYRFRIDDGTFFVDTEFESYHQAIMIHQRILGDSENAVMRIHEVDPGTYLENSFMSSEFITWLVFNDVVRDRYAGVTLGQQFLDILVIKPVLSDSVEFFDDATIYKFLFDLDHLIPLHKSLNVGEDDNKSIDDSAKRLSIGPNLPKKCLTNLWKGQNEEIVEPQIAKNLDMNDNNDEIIPHLKPVVLREVTVAELMNKESPYYWKNIRITSDSVGFGFVIRGDGPCYVQAVDPTGPASAAGLKVRMYIYSVNGKKVLEMKHTEVADEIMKGKMVDLVVLQHFRISN